MRKLLVSIIIAASALSVSCDKNIVSSVLDMKLEVVTQTVSDGGDFVFRIRTNQEAFTVKAADCEFMTRETEDILKVGGKYSPTDGSCKFTFEKVSVKEEKNSKVKVTVLDEKTGTTKTLTGHYLCQVFDPELEILKDKVRAGKDSLTFRVRSNHGVFLITRWSCSNVTLRGANFAKDSVYDCGSGWCRFSAFVAKSDSTATESELSLTLYDSYVDDTVAVKGNFTVIPKN